MPLRCAYFGHRVSHSFMQRDPMSFELRSACRRCGAPLVVLDGKWKVEGERADSRDDEQQELERPAA